MRRLLPVYLPDLRVAQARNREHEEDMRERAALLARLQLLLPGSIAPQGHARDSTTVWLQCPTPVSGSVRIDRCGRSITLELNALPATTVHRILTVLIEVHHEARDGEVVLPAV